MSASLYEHSECKCNVVPPSADGFLSLVRRFYEADGLAAMLLATMMVVIGDCFDYPEVHGDGDGGYRLMKLRADAKDSTEKLDVLLQKYLVKALASEMQHFNYDLVFTKKPNLEEFKKKYNIDNTPPCPICNPDKALRFARICFRAFSDFEWCTSYGGKAWANIAEALIGRLEGKVVSTQIKQLNYPHKVYWNNGNSYLTMKSEEEAIAFAKGAKGPIVAKATCKLLGITEVKDLGPKCAEVNGFCAKPAVFVDYVLDLEHNTGTCLNKGWLHIDFVELKDFQDIKRNKNVLDYSESYPAEKAVILARQLLTVPAEKEKNEVVDGLCNEFKTPKGSTYKIQTCVIKGVVETKVWHNGVEQPNMGLKHNDGFKAESFHNDYVAVLKSFGTSHGKNWVSSYKCKCGFAKEAHNNMCGICLQKQEVMQEPPPPIGFKKFPKPLTHLKAEGVKLNANANNLNWAKTPTGGKMVWYYRG